MFAKALIVLLIDNAVRHYQVAVCCSNKCPQAPSTLMGTFDSRMRHALRPMSTPIVQPQFRPTTADLLGDRWRALPRGVRWAIVAIAVLIAAYFAYGAVRATPGRHVVVVRGSHPVNFLYTAPLQRVKPARGELVALQTPRSDNEPQRFAVRPLTLPRYGGDPGAALVLYSVALDRYLEAHHPGLIVRGEARTGINQRPAYQVTWQTKVNGRTTFGRDIMVVEDMNAARVGAILEMQSVISPHVPQANAIGGVNPLKLSLRSFRLGTERP
jgi:hypothetical protein